jgi:hypothetical protein
MMKICLPLSQMDPPMMSLLLKTLRKNKTLKNYSIILTPKELMFSTIIQHHFQNKENLYRRNMPNIGNSIIALNAGCWSDLTKCRNILSAIKEELLEKYLNPIFNKSQFLLCKATKRYHWINNIITRAILLLILIKTRAQSVPVLIFKDS